jgi:hypothetical protein
MVTWIVRWKQWHSIMKLDSTRENRFTTLRRQLDGRSVVVKGNFLRSFHSAIQNRIGCKQRDGHFRSYHPNMSDTEQQDIIWEKDDSTFEIRTQGTLPDGRPALDEIVALGASVHLEQMNHDQWWMGIDAGGKYFHLNFALENGRLSVHLSDQSDDQGGGEYICWDGDNREHPIPGENE